MQRCSLCGASTAQGAEQSVTLQIINGNDGMLHGNDCRSSDDRDDGCSACLMRQKAQDLYGSAKKGLYTCPRRHHSFSAAHTHLNILQQ